ncbi:hypothetical protein, partial [Vibrio thalassae]
NRFLSIFWNNHNVIFAIMFNVSLALPVSHMTSFELAGSIKEVIFPSMHAVTAEPFRVTPPEAVVYQVSITAQKRTDPKGST